VWWVGFSPPLFSAPRPQNRNRFSARTAASCPPPFICPAVSGGKAGHHRALAARRMTFLFQTTGGTWEKFRPNWPPFFVFFFVFFFPGPPPQGRFSMRPRFLSVQIARPPRAKAVGSGPLNGAPHALRSARPRSPQPARFRENFFHPGRSRDRHPGPRCRFLGPANFPGEFFPTPWGNPLAVPFEIQASPPPISFTMGNPVSPPPPAVPPGLPLKMVTIANREPGRIWRKLGQGFPPGPDAHRSATGRQSPENIVNHHPAGSISPFGKRRPAPDQYHPLGVPRLLTAKPPSIGPARWGCAPVFFSIQFFPAFLILPHGASTETNPLGAFFWPSQASNRRTLLLGRGRGQNVPAIRPRVNRSPP